MSISSPLFILCLICAFTLYLIVPKKVRGILLLFFSCAFIAYASIKALPIMLLYTLAAYVFGFAVDFAKSRKAKKALTALFCVLAVAFLGLYKYLGFIFDLFRIKSAFSLAAPIGISYVTFQAIAYVVDICRGKQKAEGDIVALSLYLLYFAKILAGPIEAPGDFLGKLENASPDKRSFAKGWALIVSGFLKKVIAADLLAPSVAAFFDADAKMSGTAAIIASILFSVQIFADFSGYTDIARGASLLFGIDLCENFDCPYAAISIRDFWRRWHITLSTWLKNYIYIPLGGNRKGKARKYLNTFITFTVSGLWHGADLSFVLWGALHGIAQIIEDISSPITKKLEEKDKHGLLRVPRIIFTFVIVTVLWIFFRANSLSDLSRIFGSFGEKYVSVPNAFGSLSLTLVTLALAAGALVLSYITRRAIRRYADGKLSGILLFILCIVGAFAVAAVMISVAGTVEASSFIYTNF